MNNTKPLQEFDDETQGAIRKIMYEQQRKQMGLPTTEEEKQLEAIKSAWDAEGSPFKGKPFDPSLINFSGGQGNPHSWYEYCPEFKKISYFQIICPSIQPDDNFGLLVC